MQNFKDISYLQFGNPKQKLAYKELTELKIFEKLASYIPVLCGTIPIEIDILSSDLDIICYCKNLEQFKKELIKHFSKEENFSVITKLKKNRPTIISRFQTQSFTIEIFGQNLLVNEQAAYKHMLIEAKLLATHGKDFKNKIIELKKKGLKTEPAFAKLLNFKGDPYNALLELV